MKMYQVSTGYMGSATYQICEVEVTKATARFVTIKGHEHRTAKSTEHSHFAETRQEALEWIEEQLTRKLSRAKHNKEQAEKDIAYYEKELKDLKNGKF